MAWNTWRTVRVGNVSTTEAVPQAVAHG
jgi:cytochrome c oxidase cbb3-type subunit 1